MTCVKVEKKNHSIGTAEDCILIGKMLKKLQLENSLPQYLQGQEHSKVNEIIAQFAGCEMS